jgi:hypothetical protein
MFPKRLYAATTETVSMTLTDEIEKFRTAGRVTVCPPAYCAPVSGAVPRIEDRQALADHARRLDERRVQKLPRRQELRDESPPHIPHQRQNDRADRRPCKIPEINPQEKTSTKGAESVNDLSGRGTTRNVITLGKDIVQIFHTQSGHEILYREHRGRMFVSLIDRHNQPKETLELK